MDERQSGAKLLSLLALIPLVLASVAATSDEPEAVSAFVTAPGFTLSEATILSALPDRFTLLNGKPERRVYEGKPNQQAIAFTGGADAPQEVELYLTWPDDNDALLMRNVRIMMTVAQLLVPDLPGGPGWIAQQLKASDQKEGEHHTRDTSMASVEVWTDPDTGFGRIRITAK